jgi:hypothetical protein
MQVVSIADYENEGREWECIWYSRETALALE